MTHYVEAWILPPGIFILLLLIGILLYRYRARAGIISILMGVISLWLASTPIVAYHFIESLQNQYPVLQLISPKPHSVIVVLGGGDDTHVEENNKHTVSDITLNRLRYAAYLHKKTNLPIIVSGGYTAGAKESEADLMLNSLRHDFNIPAAIKEDKSINTADESQLMVPILKAHHFDVVYLVTNAWHMPRSVSAFARVGIAVIPAPMGYEIYDHRYSLLSYFPSMKALDATGIAMHEYIGLFWYAL